MMGFWCYFGGLSLPALRSSCFFTPQDDKFLSYGKCYVKKKEGKKTRGALSVTVKKLGILTQEIYVNH